jgi:endonuclease YncB( thermonuclease family)
MRPFLSALVPCLILSVSVISGAREALGEETGEKPAIRDVTPPGMIKVFRSQEAAPVPLHDTAPRFPAVHVLPNGLLRSGATTIQLYGIALPDRRKLCSTASGTRWACGTLAFIALRNLVEKQTLACESNGMSDQNNIAVCRIGQTNVSAWLLQEGWAELSVGVSDKNYVDAAASGRAKSAGIWGDGPSVTLATGQPSRAPTFASPTIVEGRHFKK